jgi:hypothetical protein
MAQGYGGWDGYCAIAPPSPEGHLSSPNSNTWKAFVQVEGFLVGVFLQEKGGGNRGTKAPFPYFMHIQGKKKTYNVVQNDIVLSLSFFFLFSFFFFNE